MTQNHNDIITISSREFRTNQRYYLDQVAQGVELLVTRKKEAFKVSMVDKDDTLMSKKDFYSMIEEAKKQAEQGMVHSMKPEESLDGFLDRMVAEGHVQS